MRKRISWKKIGAFLALCAAGAIGSPAQTFTVLANFPVAANTPGALVQGNQRGILWGRFGDELGIG